RERARRRAPGRLVGVDWTFRRCQGQIWACGRGGWVGRGRLASSGRARAGDAAGGRTLGEWSNDAIRVLIVDDHGLFRRGLEATLQLEPDIEVVGEAGDGGDALVKAQELLPDVVLMDVRMPRRSGIEACTAIKQAVPSARIVMLTMSDDEADLYEAVKAGASGYLLKEIPVEELAGSIRAGDGGQSVINPSLASKLLTEFATMSKRGVSPQSVPAPKLTAREMEVLRAVARGLNNREIAKELFISENTVKNHIRNILEKLQLHSRMEAVVDAVREKLLEITRPAGLGLRGGPGPADQDGPPAEPAGAGRLRRLSPSDDDDVQPTVQVVGDAFDPVQVRGLPVRRRDGQRAGELVPALRRLAQDGAR